MKTLNYVTNTWLVAQLLHPWIFILYAVAPQSEDLFSIVPLIFFYGFLFSLPAYAFCLPGFHLIRYLKINSALKFLSWLVVQAFSIFISIWLVMGMEFRFLNETASPIIPGLISAVLSTFIRYYQFIKAAEQPAPSNESQNI